ncbi:hypothetical protein JI735_34330 (plasmid) [Paenibacillus sonchi]|uniref:Uncharacterized protein n=1 Tax=Paenibacillus sonchi TaxID=373687 RepID=A0A974PIE6_9BACL|nr:hypothetical protein [Paenibacillus sonchi]QQZ64517.1 hypothetical protein JI735_34330 [Paenibacillus sonchi]
MDALLTAEQDVGYDSTGNISASAIQVFHVKGSPFSLDQNEIRVHPPNNSKGNFGNILPHLTVTRTGMLWEKKLNLPDNAGENLPWLALLMLRESEWPGDGKPMKGTVNQFQHSSDTTLYIPQLEDVLSEEADTLCQYIEITVQQFQELMPDTDIHSRGLRYFVGARTNQTDESQGMSVITAHRFPQVDQDKKDGNQFRVYLVSLEGLECCLQDKWPSGIVKVRMLCLYHWSFTSIPSNGESFHELMEQLLQHTSGSDTWLRYPQLMQTSGIEHIENRRNDGYVPHVYHTRSGEETLAWYRGPFVPVSNPPEPVIKSSNTSQEAMVYDGEYGTFDLSYAVAFELGRLMALADTQFTVNLMKWRKNLTSLFTKHYLTDDDDTQINDRFEDIFSNSDWANNVQKALKYNTEQTVLTQKRVAWRRESRRHRPNPIKVIERIMDRRDLSYFNTLRSSEEQQKVTDWISEAAEHVDIPLSHMVPMDQMLPTEHMRVFRIDPSWIRFFIEGATSIGVQTKFDVFMNQRIRNVATPGTEHLFGMLLRSALVSGWPALQIKGYNDHGDDAGTENPLRLQEQVMLTIFREVPKRITITEPHEGLSYGMNDEGTITVRHIEPRQIGDIVNDSTGQPVKVPIKNYIDPNNGVLNANECMSELIRNIPEATDDDQWMPTHFNLQLLNGADQGVFEIQP